MGCHTNFYIPKIKGKDNIINYWKAKCEYYFWEEEYDFIDWGNQEDYLFEAYLEWNFLSQQSDGEWCLYDDYHNIGDEPRIGGYPERIVTSYEDMLDFMKIGFDSVNSNGEIVHHDFYYNQDRYNFFMSEIKEFFKKYPEGIISFG